MIPSAERSTLHRYRQFPSASKGMVILSPLLQRRRRYLEVAIAHRLRDSRNNRPVVSEALFRQLDYTD